MRSILEDVKRKISMPWFSIFIILMTGIASQNQIEDARLCRHLCSTTLVLKTKTNTVFSNCEVICFELTRTLAGEICPYEKYCPNGCPCKQYQCEKLINEQEYIPVWNLKEKTKTSVPIGQEAELIYRRNDGRQQVITKSPASFYDFGKKRFKRIEMKDQAETFSSHERFTREYINLNRARLTMCKSWRETESKS
jgi:hypothetical protein